MMSPLASGAANLVALDVRLDLGASAKQLDFPAKLSTRLVRQRAAFAQDGRRSGAFPGKTPQTYATLWWRLGPC